MWGWKAAAAVALGLGLVIGGVAVAAIPDSSGVISACYAKSNGVLRVIDAEAGDSCVANKELPLSWNQQGPQGPAGPPGPAGGGTIVTREVFGSPQEFPGGPGGLDMEVARAECADGEFVTGGGYEIGVTEQVLSNQVTVRDNHASGPVLGGPPYPTHWQVVAFAPTSIGIGNWFLLARAICATQTSDSGPLP